MRLWRSEIVFAILLCCGTAQSLSTTAVCPKESLSDFVLGFSDSICSLSDSLGSIHYVGVTQVTLFFFLFNPILKIEFL